MALAFGKASDFILDDTEVQDMYQNIQSGTDMNVELEGNLVNEFQELINLEKSHED